MSARFLRIVLSGLCASLLGAGVGLAGCALPGTSTGTPTRDFTAGVAQAVFDLQSILGLPDGTVTKPSSRSLVGGSAVTLTWPTGRAEVDPDRGCISLIVIEPSETSPTSSSGTSTSVAPGTTSTTAASPVLAYAELDKEADRILELLGWDRATLIERGFTPGTSRTVTQASGAVYRKTWVGHDEDGVPNQGLIELGLDTTTGGIRTYLFTPGPWKAAASAQTITSDEAVHIAERAATETRPQSVIAANASDWQPMTGAPSGAVTVANITLVHTDATGLTGGGDALVWIVRIRGDTIFGEAAVAVYVDAATGKVLDLSLEG